MHFWLGIAIAVLSIAVTADWYLSRRRDGTWHRPVVVPILAVLIVIGVAVQGHLGGRMTYTRPSASSTAASSPIRLGRDRQ